MLSKLEWFGMWFSDADKLLEAAIKNRSYEKAQAALKYGANPQEYKNQDYRGDYFREDFYGCHLHYGSHLEHAIIKNTYEIVQLLIENGAKANKKNNYGETPLIQAIKMKCGSDIIALLLNAGAKVNKEDNEGNTPLLMAIEMEGRSDIITLLLNAGADANKGRNKGNTPLIEAIAGKCGSDIIALLLNAGAEVNEAIREGKTSLMAAVDYNYGDIATLLIKNDAMVDYVNNKGESALFYAARAGNLNMIKLLMEAGADFDMKNNEGRTAEMYSNNNKTRLLIKNIVQEKNNSLLGKLKEFETLRQQLLNKDYSSEKIAEKFAKEISDITWNSTSNNVKFNLEHMDKLPINFKNVSNALFEWAELLTVLNSSELTQDEQEQFDRAARANRELAAALGHADAKRIVERYNGVPKVHYEKEELNSADKARHLEKMQQNQKNIANEPVVLQSTSRLKRELYTQRNRLFTSSAEDNKPASMDLVERAMPQ